MSLGRGSAMKPLRARPWKRLVFASLAKKTFGMINRRGVNGHRR